MKPGRCFRKLIDSCRSSKKTIALYTVLRVMALLTLIRSPVTHSHESAATCVPVLLLFLVPAFIEDKTDLTILPVVFAAIGYVTLRTSKSSKITESLMIRPNVHESNLNGE